VYFENPEIAQLTTTGLVGNAAISPDGKYVAYTTAQNEPSLRLRQIATGADVELLPPAAVKYFGITFSPDSSYMYYVSAATGVATPDVFELSVLGGAPRKLIHDSDSPIAFSPKGDRIAFVRGNAKPDEDTLILANADGTAERVLAKRSGGERFNPSGEAGPSWSPDGNLIAVPIEGPARHYVAVFSVNGAVEKTVGPTNWGWINSVAWTQDGRALVLSATSPLRRLYQIWELSYPSGHARLITRDIAGYGSISLTATSDVLSAVRYQFSSNLWIVDANAVGPKKATPKIRQLTTGTGELGAEELSWAGETRLLYSEIHTHGEDIAAIDIPSGRTTLVTHGEQIVAGGACGCGGYILYTSRRDNETSLWRVDMDGVNPKLLAGKALHPSCSADGKWVQFASTDGGKEFRISVEGGAAMPIDQPGGAEVSPDGRLLAYWTQTASDRSSISIALRSGGGPIKTIDLPLHAHWHWHPDSQAIDFARDDRRLWQISIDGGTPRSILDFDSGTISSFAWSPSGKSLALSRALFTSDVVLLRNAQSK
jgi:Tol biopolymer transport system component